MKCGVVLSGGGAKGAYEVGFLKALNEFGITTNAISGTSIGALNGALISAGVSVNELEEIWRDIEKLDPIALRNLNEKVAFKGLISIAELFVLFSPQLKIAKGAKFLFTPVGEYFKNLLKSSDDGVFKTNQIGGILEQYAPPQKLANGIPFYTCATKSDGWKRDLTKFIIDKFDYSNDDINEYFHIQSLNDDEKINAILASASLPLIFEAKEIGGIKYSDGGITDKGNTPIRPLIENENCDIIFVCHLANGSLFNKNEYKNSCIFEIRPKIRFKPENLVAFKHEKIDEWIECGYNDAKNELAKLQSVLRQKREADMADLELERAKNRLFGKKFEL